MSVPEFPCAITFNTSLDNVGPNPCFKTSEPAMQFSHDSAIWNVFPGLVVGVLLAGGIGTCGRTAKVGAPRCLPRPARYPKPTIKLTSAQRLS